MKTFIMLCSTCVALARNPLYAEAGSAVLQAQKIDQNASHLDAVLEKPSTLSIQQQQETLGDWSFDGTFENGKPLVLSATLQDGNRVTEEMYYLPGGSLELVKVNQWWDDDHDEHASDPASHEWFYVAKNKTFYSKSVVDSKPPVIQRHEVSRSAGDLIQRTQTIASILAGKSSRMDPLKEYPGIP